MADICFTCGHDMDPHAMIAGPNPLEGGIALCPEPECPCYFTWWVPQARELYPELPDRPAEPDWSLVATLRYRLQNGLDLQTGEPVGRQR